MTRSRIGLLLGAAVLVVAGGLPTVAAAQPSPAPPAPAPSATMNEHGMWGDVLHGEGTLQTKTGPVRVAVQNGEATTLTQSSVTVRSADGFTRTWQINDNVKVYDKRHTLQPGALRTGADLMIAGKITAGTATATGTPAPATYTAQVVFVHSPPPSS
ncbi:hypothetical protein KZZ52_00650 [Dactylosporangium sp. AC04546]|uniref:hypothetical protein n=1 Tax=Dactylosporangium sp. AC04546 TaxID=2862460 RepID=UPI001EDD362D|nr:hypothetical protein [Dactylosporangium sp. AC04546]WVK83993.1 hypothetical protein KZZ52_00650 [Dactylosporangium sp. AC04546]